MNYYIFLLLIFIFPNLAISSQKNSAWGGVCNFANKSITFNFRSISGDATNDDMIFSIDAKVVDLPNAWFYPSYTYVQGIKNLCSGGIIALKYADNYVFAISKDGRPNSNFIVFVYYDIEKDRVIDFLDPKINIQYSADHDGYPLVMRSNNEDLFFRGVTEIIMDPANSENKVLLDGWFELKIMDNKLKVRNSE